MMSVKTAKGKTCNPKKQDTSVLPTSINVGVLSFLYLLVAIFILKVMDFVHTVNSGYYPIRLEEKPVTNSLFFNPPTILFIILLTVVFGFVLTWGFKTRKQKIAFIITVASLLLIPPFALVITQ
jgi:hypothetical protein